MQSNVRSPMTNQVEEPCVGHDRRLALGITLLSMGFMAVVPTVCVGAGAVPEGGMLVIPGSGLGAIPDRPSGGCGGGVTGAPLNVTFNVPQITGFLVSDVEVQLSFSPMHAWAGDITATLINASQTRQHMLFGRVGATTDIGCGDSSDLTGPYAFSDAAAPPFGGFWEAAAAATSTQPIPPGSYFTTDSGGVGAIDPMPPTSLAATFAGSSSSEVSGVWILRIVDSGVGDTGTVSAASLVLYLDGSEIIFADGFDS